MDNTKNEEISFNVNKKKLITIIISLILAVLIFVGIHFLVNYISSLKNELLSYKQEYNTVNNKYTSIKRKYNEIKLKNDSKLNFFDENIVFVLDGYGNYYYSYDEMNQVTQGKNYSYWAYNKEAAIGKGYRAFSD